MFVTAKATAGDSEEFPEPWEADGATHHWGAQERAGVAGRVACLGWTPHG